MRPSTFIWDQFEFGWSWFVIRSFWSATSTNMKPDLTQSDFSPGLDLDLCDTDNWLPTWKLHWGLHRSLGTFGLGRWKIALISFFLNPEVTSCLIKPHQRKYFPLKLIHQSLWIRSQLQPSAGIQDTKIHLMPAGKELWKSQNQTAKCFLSASVEAGVCS